MEYQTLETPSKIIEAMETYYGDDIWAELIDKLPNLVRDDVTSSEFMEFHVQAFGQVAYIWQKDENETWDFQYI